MAQVAARRSKTRADGQGVGAARRTPRPGTRRQGIARCADATGSSPGRPRARRAAHGLAAHGPRRRRRTVDSPSAATASRQSRSYPSGRARRARPGHRPSRAGGRSGRRDQTRAPRRAVALDTVGVLETVGSLVASDPRGPRPRQPRTQLTGEPPPLPDV